MPATTGTLAGMRTRLAILLVAAGAALALAGNASASPLPRDFFGVSSPDLVPLSPADRDSAMQDQRAAGVRLLRQLFDWDQIETTQGSYDWTALDAFMASAAKAGMKVLPVVLWSPHWASSCPDKDTYRNCPPAHPEDFGNFVATLIGRYGPDGTFWSSSPTLPKVPISAWQLWNEPALPVYWGGSGATPSPAEYVEMLRTAVPIIRAADPDAEIVAAGIPQSSLTGAISMHDYVSGMYAAGVKGLVDDIALHLYDDTPADAVGLVEDTRAIMDAAGDSATPIWATEWGWASAGKPNKFVTDLAGQAADVDALMGELVARHEELNIRGLTEYFWHDGSEQSNTADRWDNHLGLVFEDYTHKPAYGAFLGRAIDTTPPDTAIDSAPSGVVSPGPQAVAFSATQPGSDFECELDGSGWSACISPLPIDTLGPGTHSVSVRATDPYGNTDPTPAVASWQVPGLAVEATTVASMAPPLLAMRGLVRKLRRTHVARLARRHRLRLVVVWPAAGRITLTLRAHGILIARGSRLIRHHGRAGLTLRLRKRGKRLLARSGPLRISLSEHFKPLLSGPSASRHVTIRLRRH
jgi:polysaccharide biosynthesis protein PslG